jgi:hypothetical protein
MQTDIYALSGNRTHNPIVAASEDISCLKAPGDSDWQTNITLSIFIYYVHLLHVSIQLDHHQKIFMKCTARYCVSEQRIEFLRGTYFVYPCHTRSLLKVYAQSTPGRTFHTPWSLLVRCKVVPRVGPRSYKPHLICIWMVFVSYLNSSNRLSA